MYTNDDESKFKAYDYLRKEQNKKEALKLLGMYVYGVSLFMIGKHMGKKQMNNIWMKAMYLCNQEVPELNNIIKHAASKVLERKCNNIK